MKVIVTVTPGAREDRVERLEDGSFAVRVKALPVRGQANAAVVRILAKCFAVPASRVRIVAGWSLRRKLVEVDGF